MVDREMKTYAIYAEMEEKPRFYVEAKDIDHLVKKMRKRKSNGMFPGWCPVEVNKEELMLTDKNANQAPVIKLKDHSHYREKLSEIMNLANDLAEEIHESLFDLACLKKWKKWNDQQAMGTVFNVTDEMLRNTGDKNIDFLWELLDKIGEVKEKIHV